MIFTGEPNLRFSYIDGSHQINTNNWFLVPAEKLIVNPPPIRTRYVGIPGMDGQLDLTELQNGIQYEMRQGSWKFYVDIDKTTFEAAFENVRSYLHGQRRAVALSGVDTHFFYRGRFAVSEPDLNGGSYPSITISYALEPKRYNNGDIDKTAADQWLWDSFNFDVQGFNSNGSIASFNNDGSMVKRGDV